MPNYAHHFPDWSDQTSGMHQFTLWTALEAEGFGASLQHYNPLVDDKVKEKWDVNRDWKLRAQLVFGTPEQEWPGRKEKKDLKETIHFHGKI